MRIFIELPTWLGDCIMATPAIESILLKFPKAKFTFFGSFAATELIKNHPNCEQILIDDSKKNKSRFLSIFKTAKTLGKFDIAISFRSSFTSRFLMFFLSAKRKFKFKKTKNITHQVKKYQNFIQQSLNLDIIHDELKLDFEPFKFEKKSIGLNPGASYGSAKRWYPEYFAEVAKEFSSEFEIVIFGSKSEAEICNKIEEILTKENIECENLAGKTDIKELCEKIGGIDIFITNDSGPMHIAAAYKVPTIAIFGPTKFKETSPWHNDKAHILHLNLKCAPCMKRVCPIGTHECMKELKPQMIIEAIRKNFKEILEKRASI
ncbi:lipopolysaccharide heptosyltransferase II [Campylobacter sp. RM16192]|uniref:lipopolysaccharide heptosyltransferase II n=1 Tax=Campylobacter sp. RM16192 TaxID=1660080 RepID=UPI00145197FC|nr:lipopolysaccharide heptosyltransferase II [Campylobacter sp. RM16192]QCD52063.1 heptosyltransferase II [Campylobacter sp. RM16192]